MRKTYLGEYKRKAVALVLERKFTVKQVCKELELHENTLYRWIREIENHGQRAFPGKGSRDWISQNKLKQLEKENQKFLMKKYYPSFKNTGEDTDQAESKNV